MRRARVKLVSVHVLIPRDVKKRLADQARIAGEATVSAYLRRVLTRTALGPDPGPIFPATLPVTPAIHPSPEGA